MRIFIRKIQMSERGATAVEYGLIIALIVLAMIGALSHVASGTIGMWDDVANKVAEN